jgi:T-complex protein 1 subunit alpha
VRDYTSSSVFEPAIPKIKSLKYATEVAITILRIYDMIKLDKEQKKVDSDECMQ